jgi:hypothetical protein
VPARKINQLNKIKPAENEARPRHSEVMALLGKVLWARGTGRTMQGTVPVPSNGTPEAK